MTIAPFTSFTYGPGLAALGQGVDTLNENLQRDRDRQTLLSAFKDNPRAAALAMTGNVSGAVQLDRWQREDERDRKAMEMLGGAKPASPLPPLGSSSLGAPQAGAGTTDNGAPRGLIPSESGGHWNAQNSAVGAGGKVGHFGRIQFGQARLQDAMNAGAIPQGTTPQQFMNSEELQLAAERWHWGDIENFIRQNGFDRLVGQSIGGTPITVDGMKAVAHLGGVGGLKKFIETGGSYNPADVNGTRLSDYFSRMAGGGSGGAQQQPYQVAGNGPVPSGPVQGGNPAAMADAQRVSREGGPRQVLSAENPAVQPGAPPDGEPSLASAPQDGGASPQDGRVRLAQGGTSDAPLPISPGQFLVQRQQQRDGLVSAPPSRFTPPPPTPELQALKAQRDQYFNAARVSGSQAQRAQLQNMAMRLDDEYRTARKEHSLAARKEWEDQTRLYREQQAELRKREWEERQGPASVQEWRYAVREGLTKAPTPAAYEAEKKNAGGPDQGEVSGLRKEIHQIPSYKNLAQAAPIYQSMLETAGRDSKASDLNLVYGLGKIMDPGSVVREGEMVMVKNTASLPEWLHGAINQLNGGGALTPATRQQIMREAFGRMQGYQTMFDQDMAQYREITGRRSINADDVIPRFGGFKPFQAPQAQPISPPGAAEPARQQGNIPTVASPDEARKLPPGTRFRTQDGREFER